MADIFFFYKNGEQEGKTGLMEGGCQGEEEDKKKGYRRVNTWNIM
jgi:hypothetical protein